MPIPSYAPSDSEADLAREALRNRDRIHLTNEEIEAMTQVLDAHMFAAPVLNDRHADALLAVCFRLIAFDMR